GNPRISTAMGPRRRRLIPACVVGRVWRGRRATRADGALRGPPTATLGGAGRGPERSGDTCGGTRQRSYAHRDLLGRASHHRRGALGSDAGRTRARVLGHLVDLGAARGRACASAANHGRSPVRVRNGVAAAARTDPPPHTRPVPRAVFPPAA